VRSVPVVLTIAGSDSGGGAGIQADLKTFQALGVYGVSAVTAVTAQDTRRVLASAPVAPALVASQIDAVLSDIGADATKTGMLANAEIVRMVADRLRFHEVSTLVVDPVLLSSAGDVLLDAGGMEALMEALLPLATVVTPNVSEAAVMVGRHLETEDDLEWAARQILALGPRAAIVTGGHLAGAPVDVLYDGEEAVRIRGERVATTSTHGTGCTYSAALAAFLARGWSLSRAARDARGYVVEALRAAMPLGGGRGPLAHDHAIRERATR
jgi:hydroxymethylpyrimidine/phosphomethylpyrimidine kinase